MAMLGLLMIDSEKSLLTIEDHITVFLWLHSATLFSSCAWGVTVEPSKLVHPLILPHIATTASAHNPRVMGIAYELIMAWWLGRATSFCSAMHPHGWCLKMVQHMLVIVFHCAFHYWLHHLYDPICDCNANAIIACFNAIIGKKEKCRLYLLDDFGSKPLHYWWLQSLKG